MDISDVLSDADAVLDAYYPGQFGATAIAGESPHLRDNTNVDSMYCDESHFVAILQKQSSVL